MNTFKHARSVAYFLTLIALMSAFLMMYAHLSPQISAESETLSTIISFL